MTLTSRERWAQAVRLLFEAPDIADLAKRDQTATDDAAITEPVAVESGHDQSA